MPKEIMAQEVGDDGLTIGERIAKIRNEKGLKRTELARLSGISEVNLSKYETGRNRHLYNDTIVKLCRALKCNPAELLGLNLSSRADVAGSAASDEDAAKTEKIPAARPAHPAEIFHGCAVPVYAKYIGKPPVPVGMAVGEIIVPVPDEGCADNLIAVRLGDKDDSLTTEMICPGDILVVNTKKQDDVPSDTLEAVVIGDGDMTFRKVRLSSDGLECYLGRNVPRDDCVSQKVGGTDFKIIGKCVGVWRTLK